MDAATVRFLRKLLTFDPCAQPMHCAISPPPRESGPYGSVGSAAAQHVSDGRIVLLKAKSKFVQPVPILPLDGGLAVCLTWGVVGVWDRRI